MQKTEILSNYLKYKNSQKQRKLSLRWAFFSCILLLIIYIILPWMERILSPSSSTLLSVVRLFRTSLIVFILTSILYSFFSWTTADKSFHNLNEKQLKLLGLDNAFPATKRSEEAQSQTFKSFGTVNQQPSSLSNTFTSPNPTPTKSILLPTTSPSGLAYHSRDRREYTSPCGGDVCNYDANVARKIIHSTPQPQQSLSDQQTNQSNKLSTFSTPPRGKLPTSSTLLSSSPAPSYLSNQFSSPGNSSSGRYHASPLDLHGKKYQSGLSFSSSFPSSPLSNENGFTSPSRRNMNVGPTRVLRDAFEVLGVSHDSRLITDKGMDNLRKILGRYLQNCMKRFDIIVQVISQQLEQCQFCHHDDALVVLLGEEKGSYHLSQYRSAHRHTIEEFYQVAMSDSMAVRKPDERLGTTLLQNLTEYDSMLSLFHLPTAPSPTTTTNTHSYLNLQRPSPLILKYGIQRCRELASDSRLGKMVWDTSHHFDSIYPSDSELIMAAFLHYCDLRHLHPDHGSFSSAYYICDLAGSPSLMTIPPTSPILIAQRSSKPSHFNIYINRTSSSSTASSILELVIPEGRQNCYLAIICFLLSCQTFNDRHRSVHDGIDNEKDRDIVPKRSTLLSGPLRELFVEVLGDI